MSLSARIGAANAQNAKEKSTMRDSEVLTADELGNILHLRPRGIARIVANGVLPAYRDRCRARFSVSSLRKKLPTFYVGHNFVQPAHFCCGWMTAAMVAKKMKVSMATVLRWTRLKRVPYYRFGGHTLRFRLDEIMACVSGEKR